MGIKYKMTQIKKTLIIYFLIISCNGKVVNNKEQFLKEDKQQIENTNNEQTDFFDKKYFESYELVIDESNLNDHPFFSYLDCSTEGYFSVHFIPKESGLRLFWEKEHYKYTDFNTIDFEIDSKRIDEIMNNEFIKYNIFSYVIKKEFLNSTDGCTKESVFLNDNSLAEIYLYNQHSKKWKLIKSGKSDILPPYVNNEYFIYHFPELFPFEKNLKLNDNKNSDKTENLTLFKNFIFKFSISKFEDENGNEEQKIKINLVNKQTNKIQEIDFIPKSLVIKFDVRSSNCISYFDMEKLIINSYQEIEGGNMLIALDVNFDGLEDFAIINYQGSNGGPQYAYYVQKPNKQFVLDSYLTETVRFFPFEINKNKKILTIIHPSGCCQIQTYKFQIQPNGEWKNIYSNLEDIK
jgi:hypothetical protein